MALSDSTLKIAIKNAFINMASMQKDATKDISDALIERLADDLKNAIANYVRSATITPGNFTVPAGSIATVGGPAAQAGPPAPVSLLPATITLDDMN